MTTERSSTITTKFRCPHERLRTFCKGHWSWLCSRGQGKCQTEGDCPEAGKIPQICPEEEL